MRNFWFDIFYLMLNLDSIFFLSLRIFPSPSLNFLLSICVHRKFYLQFKLWSAFIRKNKLWYEYEIMTASTKKNISDDYSI